MRLALATILGERKNVLHKQNTCDTIPTWQQIVTNSNKLKDSGMN